MSVCKKVSGGVTDYTFDVYIHPQLLHYDLF